MSENKPVGSTDTTNLLGDEPVSPTNGNATSNDQELFGGGSPSPAPNGAPSQRSTIDDILGLFGPGPTASPAPHMGAPSPAPGPSLFDVVSSSSSPPPSLFATSTSPPPSQPAPAPSLPRLASYTAYDKNQLKITLTPQTSAAKPGIVLIQARFQVTGGGAAENVTFQAAVPKVRIIVLAEMLMLSSSSRNNCR